MDLWWPLLARHPDAGIDHDPAYRFLGQINAMAELHRPVQLTPARTAGEMNRVARRPAAGTVLRGGQSPLAPESWIIRPTTGSATS